MQKQAEQDRGWDQWPGRTPPDDRARGRLRSLFGPTDDTDAIADLITMRGKELEERSARLRIAVGELEQREARARGLHTRVEQILRDGAAELDLRQTELSAQASDLDRREAALVETEATIEERRRELGAVELRRAAIERREDALRVRENRARGSCPRARGPRAAPGRVRRHTRWAPGPDRARGRVHRASRGRPISARPRPRPRARSGRIGRGWRRAVSLHQGHGVAASGRRSSLRASRAAPARARARHRLSGSSAEPGVEHGVAEEERDNRACGKRRHVRQRDLPPGRAAAKEHDDRRQRSEQ